MRYVVFSLFLAGWVFMWWWTYVFHIKACLEWPAWRVEDVTYIRGDNALPLSFRWSDPVPVLSDHFEGWVDSLRTAIQDEDILFVTGLAYRDERFEGGHEALSQARADAIVRLLSEDIPENRLQQSAMAGDLGGDYRQRLFRGFRIDVLTRSTLIRETPEFAAFSFPFDSVNTSGMDPLIRFFQNVGRKAMKSGSQIILKPCVALDSTEISDPALYDWRNKTIQQKLLDSGIREDQLIVNDTVVSEVLKFQVPDSEWDPQSCFILTLKKTR